MAGLVPPGSTTFHLLLAMHIAAGLTCVVSGTAAALSPRRRGRHPGLEPLLPVARGGVRLRGPGWPHCAGRRMPTCWSSAPCRLPPPPLAGLPGVDGGDGIAGAGTDSYESMSHMHGHGDTGPSPGQKSAPGDLPGRSLLRLRRVPLCVKGGQLLRDLRAAATAPFQNVPAYKADARQPTDKTD